MNRLLWSLLAILWMNAMACSSVGNKTPTINKKQVGEKKVLLDSISTLPGTPQAYTDTILLLVKTANKLQHRDSALYLYRKALWISNYMQIDEGMALSLLHIGLWYLGEHNYTRAIKYYHQTLSYCRGDSGRCPKIRSESYRHLGDAYMILLQYDSAMAWYERSLQSIEKITPIDTVETIAIYLSIGATLAVSTGPLNTYHNRALFYLHKAYNLTHAYQKKGTITALSARNLAALYHLKSNYDMALPYYKEALVLYGRCNCAVDRQAIYTYLSNIFRAKDNLSMAKLYLDSALSTATHSDENDADLDLCAGAYYYAIQQFDKAKSFYEKALEKTIATKALVNLPPIYKELAGLYDTMGHWEAAYRSLKKYTELALEDRGEKLIKTMQQTETKYRATKMQKELVEKRYLIARQNNKIKNQYLGMGAAVTGLLLLAGLYYRHQQKTTISTLKARLEGEEKERIRLAAELHDGIVSRLSYAKMNFDLLNPAETHTQVNAGEYQGALDFLEQSIAELRSTAHNMLPSALQRAGLIRALHLHCDKMSHILPMRIDFIAEGELPPLTEEFELNIYRMVQELLNNVVKYAQAHFTEVQLSVSHQHLHIKVQDDGIGLPDDKLNAGTGTGLFNLRNRLKILGGHLHISNTEGTTFDMHFDLKPHLKKNL